MTAYYSLLLFIFAISIFVWVFLVNLFIHRISHQYPYEYQSLGAPGFFHNNNLKNNLRFLRFIWSFRFRHMKDRYFSFICYGLCLDFLLLLSVYLVIVLWLPDYVLQKVTVAAR